MSPVVNADGRRLVVRPGELAELRRLCERLDTEEQVLAIVLDFVRSDDRVFSPPADLEVTADALARTPHVTIAAIDGDCVDEGLALALACDLRVAAPGARLGFPGVTTGAVPAESTVRRLAAMIGRSRVADLALTGRTIDGATAAQWGLVEVAADGADPMERAVDLARLICDGAPLAMRYAKEAVDRGYPMRLEDGLGLEGDLYAILQTTSDRMEGIRSFRERRSPDFTGR